MEPKCLLTSTDLQTRRARCQHQLSFLSLQVHMLHAALVEMHTARHESAMKLVFNYQACTAGNASYAWWRETTQRSDGKYYKSGNVSPLQILEDVYPLSSAVGVVVYGCGGGYNRSRRDAHRSTTRLTRSTDQPTHCGTSRCKRCATERNDLALDGMRGE